MQLLQMFRVFLDIANLEQLISIVNADTSLQGLDIANLEQLISIVNVDTSMQGG